MIPRPPATPAQRVVKCLRTIRNIAGRSFHITPFCAAIDAYHEEIKAAGIPAHGITELMRLVRSLPETHHSDTSIGEGVLGLLSAWRLYPQNESVDDFAACFHSAAELLGRRYACLQIPAHLLTAPAVAAQTAGWVFFDVDAARPTPQVPGFDMHRPWHSGRGGSGHVWLARDRITNCATAIKIFRGEKPQGDMPYSGLFNELRFQTDYRLHRCVRPIQAGLTHDERGAEPFIALEWLDGGNVQSARQLRLHGRNPDAVARDMIAAVAELHRCKILHRDIKPGNFLLPRPGLAPEHARIIDCGIATRFRDMNDVPPHPGTREYAPPETAFGAGTEDPTRDVYSLGCVLYEFYTESAPYRTPWEHHRAFLRNATASKPNRRIALADWQSATPKFPLPAHVAPMIHGAIPLLANQRYPDADVMLDAFDRQVGHDLPRTLTSDTPRAAAFREWEERLADLEAFGAHDPEAPTEFSRNGRHWIIPPQSNHTAWLHAMEELRQTICEE